MLRRHFNALLFAMYHSRLRAQGSRPGLLLNPGKIETIKAAINTTHAELWRSARRRADGFAARPVPQYEQPGPNDEQLWERDVANRIPLLALAFLLSEDPKYLRAATAWTMASCGYPQWGTGYFNGTDLAAGHQLFALALVFDWLGDRLPAEARTTLRRTLLERGAKMYATPADIGRQRTDVCPSAADYPYREISLVAVKILVIIGPDKRPDHDPPGFLGNLDSPPGVEV